MYMIIVHMIRLLLVKEQFVALLQCATAWPLNLCVHLTMPGHLTICHLI